MLQWPPLTVGLRVQGNRLPSRSVAQLQHGEPFWNRLPAIMGKGLVGLSHPVGILSLLDRRSGIVGRVE